MSNYATPPHQEEEEDEGIPLMDIHNASPNVSSDQNNDLKGGREVYGLNDEINDYGSSPKKTKSFHLQDQ